MGWIQQNWALIASVLWGLCEVLALIPSVKSNSVFTLTYNTLKSVLGKKDPAQLP